MIREEKREGALSAIHSLMVSARAIAYELKHKELIAILDVGEHLPLLFLREEDLTEYMRGQLEALKERWPSTGIALAMFDK